MKSFGDISIEDDHELSEADFIPQVKQRLDDKISKLKVSLSL